MSDTRVWMYRKGEARLFEHRSHVPQGGGWQRFPVACGEEEAPAAPEPPAPAPRESAAAPERGALSLNPADLAQLEQLSHRRLMRIAADAAIPFETSWSKAQLRHAILEASRNGDDA